MDKADKQKSNIYDKISEGQSKISDQIIENRKSDAWAEKNANVSTFSTVVGDGLISNGASTIFRNPEQAPEALGEIILGGAIKAPQTTNFFTDSALHLHDWENRRRHLESYKRPETPTLGDMQSPNF